MTDEVILLAIHEFDDDMLSDDNYLKGHIRYLVTGNQCRLLDGRRTTGYIEEYFHDSGMFRWRIVKYEDEGKYWDLPAEQVSRFQFYKDSHELNEINIEAIKQTIEKFDKSHIINIDTDEKVKSEKEIMECQHSVKRWLLNHSQLVRSNSKLDSKDCSGSPLLWEDLKTYMESVGFEEEERRTAELMVLNPNSGEWIKGMSIVLAEMGLVSYKGKTPRTKDIFFGLGAKKNRRAYIIHRLAFIRVFFSLMNVSEVTLYRGMCSENRWSPIQRTYLPCTLNLDVAKAFSNFDDGSKFQISYLVKITTPIEKLFMTFLETEAMNRQYQEAEVIILYDEVLTI